jgi:hypothetical protein
MEHHLQPLVRWLHRVDATTRRKFPKRLPLSQQTIGAVAILIEASTKTCKVNVLRQQRNR